MKDFLAHCAAYLLICFASFIVYMVLLFVGILIASTTGPVEGIGFMILGAVVLAIVCPIR